MILEKNSFVQTVQFFPRPSTLRVMQKEDNDEYSVFWHFGFFAFHVDIVMGGRLNNNRIVN